MSGVRLPIGAPERMAARWSYDNTAVLMMQDPQGLVCWPEHRVASLTPEVGRIRCVMADGSVAHRPGALPEGPWVALGESRVWPGLLRRAPGCYLDPAGFAYPLKELPVLSEPPPTPAQPGLPCPPDEVLQLRGEDGRATWVTDRGEFDAGLYAAQAAEKHPHLAPAGRGTYVNLRRLRRIYNERQRFRLVLDNGLDWTVSYGPHEKLCQALGLPHLYHLEPCLVAQYREALRDYPMELKLASGAWLKTEFVTCRRLIANLMWQVVRWRQQGRSEVAEYGVIHRDFFYDPLESPIDRAGFATLKRRGRRLKEDELRASDPIYNLYLEVAGTLVGEDRLFTYRELGFEDPRPDLRTLGTRHPERLLLAEKHSLARYTRTLGKELGCSTLIMGGVPSLLSTEFCIRALLEAGVAELDIAAYGDFDPGGWIAAEGFVQQAERYGMAVRRLQYVVLPGCFTREEIDLHSRPIEADSPQIEGKVKAWLAQSGGIDHQARRMGADHLKPLARLRERLSQLWPDSR